jgi:hypothetical protein
MKAVLMTYGQEILVENETGSQAVFDSGSLSPSLGLYKRYNQMKFSIPYG